MSQTESSATSGSHFPTTAWTFIRVVQDDQASQHLPAMNRFMARYWKPVFYFLRARGRPLHHAEDLTQEFFLRLLEHKWLDKADSQRGRFRTYLASDVRRLGNVLTLRKLGVPIAQIRELLNLAGDRADILNDSKAVSLLRGHLELLKSKQGDLTRQIEQTMSALEKFAA